jgi:hypothetical protein
MTNSQISKSVDKLVWFGDSWPAGDPNPSGLTFPNLVGKNLNISSLNYARSGASIPQLISQFIEWKNNVYDSKKDYILIACLTNENRFYWKNDNNWFTIAPYAIESENVQSFYKHTYNIEAVDFYNMCCIGHLKNLCNELNVPLYFLRNFKHMNEELISQSLLDIGLIQFLLDNPDAVWSPQLKDQIKYGQLGKGLFSPCIHPNLAGHTKIASILTDKLRTIIKTN